MNGDDRFPTPEERAEELSYQLANAPGTSDVSWSADDSALVTCYAHREYTEEVERIIDDSRFDVVHKHGVGDELHYVFGYSSEM